MGETQVEDTIDDLIYESFRLMQFYTMLVITLNYSRVLDATCNTMK